MMKKIVFKLYQLIGIPIDILRYFNFFPFLFKNKNSSQIDYYITKNILKCDYYLEYGSGFTTSFAIQRKKKFFRSVEMDNYFYNYFSCKQVKLINFGICKIPSTPHFFFIRKHFLKNQILRYVNFYHQIITRLNKKKIFLFVDGRFRLLILIFLHKFYKSNIKVVLDDYKNYQLNDIKNLYNYKIVKKRYLEIISKKKVSLRYIESLKIKYFYDLS
jgi:hypothetical protein